MISSMQYEHPVAIGTQPRSFVDPTSAVPVDPLRSSSTSSVASVPQGPARELAGIEAELEAAKTDAKAASDRATELEGVAGAWNIQLVVVELQRARAIGAVEAARNGQTHALRRMWELGSERDRVLELRRQRDERRRELQGMLADG